MNKEICDILVYDKCYAKILDKADGAYYILKMSNLDNKYIFDPSDYLVACHKLDVLEVIKKEPVSENERLYFESCLNIKKEFDKRMYEVANMYIYDKQF